MLALHNYAPPRPFCMSPGQIYPLDEGLVTDTAHPKFRHVFTNTNTAQPDETEETTAVNESESTF